MIHVSLTPKRFCMFGYAASKPECITASAMTLAKTLRLQLKIALGDVMDSIDEEGCMVLRFPEEMDWAPVDTIMLGFKLLAGAYPDQICIDEEEYPCRNSIGAQAMRNSPPRK